MKYVGYFSVCVVIYGIGKELGILYYAGALNALIVQHAVEGIGKNE